jgi:octaprenyl-diphosphate synthase
MDQLSAITQSIKKEIEIFQLSFKDALQQHNPVFQGMMDYVAETNGKRIRPIILLLSAQLCGAPNQRSIDYAIILELLHTATLIHDDVVDTTLERRGKPSVNALFDNRAAVLTGDYILSLAISQAIKTHNFQVLQIMGQLSKNLVEGELTQLVSSKTTVIDENRYFEVIRKKTATLISSCMELGALSVDASPENRETVRMIGENLGICFQIKDDIFDYFEQGEIGKPTGNDIREGKITLPLIHALRTAPAGIAASMLSIIENQSFSSDNILKLTGFTKEYQGIEYATICMQSIKAETLKLLERFPASEAKTELIRLIDYIIERRK